jgi:predicted acylesterase/phospholipase RssA
MPKRSLILAGGGLKVGFQAGVLQVWLDEAGLQFDHADGASGGCFNLTMYCQGMTGKKIADNWRNLDPFLPIDLNWEQYWRFLSARSLFTYDNFRQRVLPFWGVDWQQVRTGRLGTFNLFNFSKKRLEVVTNDAMSEDHLVGSVSLPMWFPPVQIGGDTYIDAVYITDANVEEAIRRGADELWAIWTVSTRNEWRDGFVAQYFHIIETTADTNFFSIWRRIEESNRRIAQGEAGEFGRHIELKLLQAEVPVHYLINLSKDRMAEAVNLGVKMARDWCAANNVPLVNPGPPVPPPSPQPSVTSLSFTEEMKGHVGRGEPDPVKGEKKGKTENTRLDVKFTLRIDDADAFITSPLHEARIAGTMTSPLIGGTQPVQQGTFNLLVQQADPRRKQMRYRVVCLDGSGQQVTMYGEKHVENDDGLDLWEDTTKLFVKVFEGVVPEGGESVAIVRGAGIIRIEPFDFLRQMTTFRAEGPTVAARLDALTRFGALFMGKLWDVYGHGALRV